MANNLGLWSFMQIRHRRKFSTYKKWKAHYEFEQQIARLAIRMALNPNWDGIDPIFACEALRRLGHSNPNAILINYMNS